MSKKNTKEKKNNIFIKNRKAYHDYTFLETIVCGIVLVGTEIKSIRQSKVSFTDSYCLFIDGELFLKNTHIDIYENGTYYNHEPKRNRKLLLTKKQLKKLSDELKLGGLTIVPISLFVNEKGFCKVEIALAKGKKEYQKKEDIKKKDLRRENYHKIKM